MIPIFPYFIPLTLADKEMYNQLVADYPPISDLAFSTLHIWWNLENNLSISTFNNNLIIHYNLQFDEDNSGYCVVGRNSLDNTIQAIFNYLKEQGEQIKLVHVPEFVVEKISSKELLNIEEEPDYNEYIMDSGALATLEDPSLGRIRRKVNRFIRETEDRKLEIVCLDLSSKDVIDQLFQTIISWESIHPAANDPDHSEHQAIKKTLVNASVLDIQNLCLYIDDKLNAITLYDLSLDGKYYVIHHLKVDYNVPFIFDYVTSIIAKKAVERGVPFLNMEMDLGIEGLRRHKMGLRPVKFFKKYTIKFQGS